MGDKTHIFTSYTPTSGVLTTDSGTKLSIGSSQGSVRAYEMLLGGLSHCLFSTFQSLAEKMQVSYERVDLDIVGIKRDEKVATLETVTIEVTAEGINDHDKFTKSFEISTRYCSVYNTISHVAKIEWNVTFV